MYIGAVLPWKEFHQPELTGITYGRLFGLGFMVMAVRRMPAVFAAYKFMPKVCKSWKEALFMGYYGPIGKRTPSRAPTGTLLTCSTAGVGAVFYLEHTRHLFPELGEGDEEETNLIRALGPSKYLTTSQQFRPIPLLTNPTQPYTGSRCSPSSSTACRSRSTT